jgi:hypothetical protein
MVLVVAAQGDFDQIVLSSNRIWNQYNIPYCGHQLTDIQFSNRKKYPNLFRLTTAITGHHFVKLFKFLNVKRVAIIAGPPSPGGQVSLMARKNKDILNQNGISVIAFIPTTFEIDKNDTVQFKSVFGVLKSVDARYILIDAEPQTTADIFFNARYYKII